MLGDRNGTTNLVIVSSDYIISTGEENTTYLHLPLHSELSVQVPSSVSLPSQGKPSSAGGGLSQSLLLVLMPSPHLVEHSPHEPQSPHWPFPENRVQIYWNI